MNQHIYLRAYMAGIVVPTIFLLVVATVFTIARYVYNVPVPVERVIVFPMAVVPNAWGLWNVLFLALRSRLQLSIGLHGALLPILLAPLGIVVASLLNFPFPTSPRTPSRSPHQSCCSSTTSPGNTWSASSIEFKRSLEAWSA